MGGETGESEDDSDQSERFVFTYRLELEDRLMESTNTNTTRED
jgi:hypothetical protein